MDHHIKPPSRLSTLSEMFRAGAELLSFHVMLPTLMAHAPRNTTKTPVIVLPGFLLSDLSTIPLRKFLTGIGYQTYGWGGDRNFGPSSKTLQRMEDNLKKVYEAHGNKPVTLIGHSLGGIFATKLSRKYPHMAANVIKLGSPVDGMKYAPGINPWILNFFDKYNPSRKAALLADHPQKPHQETTNVLTLAIYTEGDGIVNWKACLDENAKNVKVTGSHIGLAFNRNVASLIAHELSSQTGRAGNHRAETLVLSA